MSADLAELLEFDDGDSGGGSDVAALDVLMRFSHLVHQRQGPFVTVVMEMLQQAIADVEEGNWSE